MQNTEQLTIIENLKRRWYLPIGDMLVLTLFASMGRASHSEGLDVPGILETAAPFMAGWLAAAPFMGAYRAEAIESPKRAVLVTGRTWIVGILLGLLFRAIYLRREIPVSFAIVTLLTTLVLLSLWRAGVVVVRNRI